jgi:hypothetical protein
MYIYVFFFLFPENTENTEPSIHVHLCFLLPVSREYWEYKTQYTCTSMFSWFCILSILWKQKQENIDVHVYWVLYSQYCLETERRKHRCTCILGSVFSVFSGNRNKKTQDLVYMYIYVFLVLFPVILRIQNPVFMYIYAFVLFRENTENTEPSIHEHLCFLISISRKYWEYMYTGFWYSQYSLETERRKHRCTCILGSIFSVFSGNRKKKT